MGNSEWEYQNQELLKSWYQEKNIGQKAEFSGQKDHL